MVLRIVPEIKSKQEVWLSDDCCGKSVTKTVGSRLTHPEFVGQLSY